MPGVDQHPELVVVERWPSDSFRPDVRQSPQPATGGGVAIVNFRVAVEEATSRIKSSGAADYPSSGLVSTKTTVARPVSGGRYDRCACVQTTSLGRCDLMRACWTHSGSRRLHRSTAGSPSRAVTSSRGGGPAIDHGRPVKCPKTSPCCVLPMRIMRMNEMKLDTPARRRSTRNPLRRGIRGARSGTRRRGGAPRRR